ncbi:hypothetical protein AGMMS49938_17090 [Fibrobacterales bacterium]|nr:hypothetical protein AGMMS49938_17090 [Fibrobacterales bacterium]
MSLKTLFAFVAALPLMAMAQALGGGSAQTPVPLATLLANPTGTIDYSTDLPFTVNGEFKYGSATLVRGDYDDFRPDYGDGSNYYAVAYKITLSEGDRIQILHNGDVGNVDAYLYLYDAQGEQVEESDDEGESYGGDGSSLIDFAVDPEEDYYAGDYYIVATTLVDDATGPYTLSVIKPANISPPVVITGISASPSEISVFKGMETDNLLNALKAQVTLTGVTAGGSSVNFHGSWTFDDDTEKYVYTPNIAPFGYEFNLGAEFNPPS